MAGDTMVDGVEGISPVAARDVLEGLPDAVVLLSRAGAPRFANARARAALGGSASAIVASLGEGIDRRPAELRVGSATFEAAWAGQGDNWVVTLRDATGRAAERENALRRSLSDPLTGLGNRAAMMEALRAELARCGELAADAGLVLVDLDKFKPVNDTLGHAVGDMLLRAVAKRLSAAVREGDGVFRLGGDEFALLLPCPDPSTAGALEASDAIAGRVIELLGRPFLIDGQMVGIGGSAGVAVSEGTSDPDDLLKRADIALYRAKEEGRGRHVHFLPGMDEAMRDRRQMEIDMRRAIALRQFELHYQPQFDLDTMVVTGFEALVRWNHPKRGQISPAEFIPLAEASALIVPLGEWVLREACGAATEWPGSVSVSVNVSPGQFAAGNLVETVQAALDRTGLEASRLVVEITESVMMCDDADTAETLRALKALGVRIAMDDFGTGYSSLSYLRSFPFDIVKVDQCFVRGEGDRERMDAIVRAVASLGQSIGMSITAEGVETMEQLEAIRRDGCGTAQGYLISRPVPSEQVKGFFTEAADAFASEPDAGRDASPPARPRVEAPPLAQDDAPEQVQEQAEAPEVAVSSPEEQTQPDPETNDHDASPAKRAASQKAAPALDDPQVDGESVLTLDGLAAEVMRAAPGELMIGPRVAAERPQAESPAPATPSPKPVASELAADRGPAETTSGEGTALHRLVYQSLCAIHDTEAALIAEVDDILAVARPKNQAAGVTGALMFNGTHYAQVLEGPREAVERIFECIQLDPRHSDVVLLSFDPAEKRLFGNWSMAHVGGADGRLASLAKDTGFDAARLKGDDVAARLHDVLTREAEPA